MSLYRTYRPRDFADVIGQDHVVKTLEQAAKLDKLAHAYLFAGSRGTGKTSVARILAKTIMTRSIEDESVRKQITKGVDDSAIVDLLEIDAASNRGIDDVRDLIEKIQFSPVVAGAKVYIIDEVHMLTKEAFNALLKTLEEPPAYAFFILATTELHKIPATIQSRCQCFPFRHIRDEDIVRRLQYIADTEKITVDREALRTIAHHVEGSMRDAISLLDQLRSLDTITQQDVQQRIGATGHEYVEQVFQAIDEHDAETLVDIIHKLEESGTPMDIFLRYVLTALRTKLHATVAEKQPTDVLVAMLDTLLQAIRDVRIAPVPGLVVESALLSLCQDHASGTQPTLASEQKAPDQKKVPDEKKEVKDAKKSATKEHVVDSKTTKQTEEPPKDDAIIEALEVSVENVQKAWPDIIAQTEPASVRMSLKDGHVTDINGNIVTVTFASAFHRDKVSATEASHAIEKVMEKHFRTSLVLQCTVMDEGETASTETDERVNLAEAAAEIF